MNKKFFYILVFVVIMLLTGCGGKSKDVFSENPSFPPPDGSSLIGYDGRIYVSKELATAINGIDSFDAEKRYVIAYDGDTYEYTYTAALESGAEVLTVEAANNEITVRTSLFFVFSITEDADYFYITLAGPRTKYAKIVMIDPGHGGDDPGAEYGGVTEKDINLEIAKLLFKMFENGNSGIKAYMTRYGDDFVYRADRPAVSNAAADLFISIHCDSYPDDTSVGGTSTYYPSDAASNVGRLKAASREIAGMVQDDVSAALGTRNRGIIANSELVVLKDAKIPAILVEVAFLTNDGERAMLQDGDELEKAAAAMYGAIVRALGGK